MFPEKRSQKVFFVYGLSAGRRPFGGLAERLFPPGGVGFAVGTEFDHADALAADFEEAA
jgi:hypothetical protein